MRISEKVKYSTTRSVHIPKVSTAGTFRMLADSRYNFPMTKARVKKIKIEMMARAMDLERGIMAATMNLVELLNCERDILGKMPLTLTEVQFVNSPARPARPAAARKAKATVKAKAEAAANAVKLAGMKTKGRAPTTREAKKANQKLARKQFVKGMRPE